MAAPQSRIIPATGLASGTNLVVDDLAGPASYTTGGVSVSASAFGLTKIAFVITMERSSDGLSTADIDSPKAGNMVGSVNVRWFVASSGAEVAPGTNLSAKRVRFLALGV